MIVVAALSDRELGGPLAIVSVAIVAVTASAVNSGLPAVGGPTQLGAMVALQIFLGSLVLTALPVTALVRRLDLQAAELEKRRREAEELSAVKTKLLAHVSHEIRSPLSGVTSLAQLLSEGVMGDLTAKQREGLDQIAQSGAEVEALARDLLDAATIQSGKASVHVVGIEVEDAVESAVTAARFRGKEYGGSVVVVGSFTPGLTVAADRLRMRQILINLIVNGLKYGGRPPVVQVAAYATERGAVRFEISDNGSGVSPELHATLFRSFDRLGAEKSDIEGAGLGLALSRELAALQGGTLGVEDGDLGGARFWLELPVWTETSGAVAA
jgi:signal transduction histidine kinase